jgi:uncharacterized membrane protein
MPTAAVLYDLVLTLHIFAVVLAFGVVFAYPLIDAQIKRAGPSALPALHRMHVAIATRLVTPAMTVALLAGLYLVIDGPYGFEEPWISATFVILFILFGLTGTLTSIDKRLAELAARDVASGGGEPSDEYRAEERKTQILGTLAWLLVIVAIFLMTAKPG